MFSSVFPCFPMFSIESRENSPCFPVKARLQSLVEGFGFAEGRMKLESGTSSDDLTGEERETIKQQRENYGKTMGKPWGNHGETMGK